MSALIENTAEIVKMLEMIKPKREWLKKPKRVRPKVESKVDEPSTDKTLEAVKPKRNRSKIVKMPTILEEPARRRRIKPETFDCALEKHFVVKIHQAFLYTKTELFELLHEEVESMCVTDIGGTVVAYLHYSTPRSLNCVTDVIHGQYKDVGHLIVVGVCEYPEEQIREMTALDLQPEFKGIEAEEFHFNMQAVWWASMTSTFSCLDPFVLRYKESYAFLFALYHLVKGL